MSDQKEPARVLDFKRPEKPAQAPPVIMSQRCICTHSKGAHLAGSGACRPGFVCLAGCQIFREKGGA